MAQPSAPAGAQGPSLGSIDSTLRGIYLVLAAVVLFASYNAIAKWLVSDYSPAQIIFFRGLFGLLPLAAFAYGAGGWPALRSQRPALQLVRAILALASNICFILAYRTMPLADAVAIGYAAPIIITALSVPLLAERVGLHRWSAVVVGFFGILVITQPGSGLFGHGALFAIMGTILYALSIIATRRLAGCDSTACTACFSTIFYVAACSLALPLVWVTPDWGDLGFFAALGLVAAFGMVLFVHAYRFAPASTLAPFDYAAIAFAALFGYLVWDEVPGLSTLAGVAIVCASGLYILRRESVTADAVAVASQGRPKRPRGPQLISK